jgi:AsmA family/AsmA-like C-terminal region
MSDEVKRRRRMRKRLWLVLTALAALLAVVVVPPLLSIGRYKGQITHLVSASLGRPVRLSSVELRLFPRPGFVITDLTVDEDPAYGAEPVLHANTVTAAIRLFSLWRGRLEISRISVDEASLNVVRTGEGLWNLDPFFRTAATRSNGAAQGAVPPFPYLEATNSRINIKNGLEKLPFSLVNADVSFWQEDPGDWRLRMRGQPARTDVSLDLADTGIVRLEATLRHAPEFRQMPIHLQMEWREAQLGQLTRLIIGSDPGWRGDLTGQLQLDGTAGAAQVRTRLSATSVHRVEFAPADPLDFDANCTFVYHYSNRGVENLVCDSPFGDGHIRVAGNLPGSAPAKLSVEVQRIPVSAGLDVLRTLRSGIGQDLQARGTLSGALMWDSGSAQSALEKGIPARRHPVRNQVAKNGPAAPGPLTGTLTVDGFILSGDGLSQPIQTSKVVLQPEIIPEGQPQRLATTVPISIGGATSLTVGAHFSLSGYELGVHGTAALARVRELAHVAGISAISALDGLAGDPANVDLDAEGLWLPTQSPPVAVSERVTLAESLDDALQRTDTGSDQIRGTLTLHNASWKSGVLANAVEISQATLNLDGGTRVWDPVVFEYGPVKGTATLHAPECEGGEPCATSLALQFSELDATAFQAALLGAQKRDTVFSSLVARFTPTSAPVWPRIDGTVKADSLILGQVRLQNAAISLRVMPTEAEFTSIDANLLGGRIHATGKLTNGDKPGYAFDGTATKLNGSALCQLLTLQCTGGPIDGNGRVELSGFADKDLASSATGTLHFEWRHGTVGGDPSAQVPKALSRFDRWVADVAIANGAVTLRQNQVQQGANTSETDATITFGDPPIVRFGATTVGDAAQR